MIRARTWSNGSHYFYIKEGSSHHVSFDYSAAVTAGQWHHWVWWYDGSQSAGSTNRMKIYIDGTEQSLIGAGSVGTSTPDLSGDNFQIGIESVEADDNTWNGSIDDIRIYSKALSAREVLELANGGFADGDNGTATFTLGAALDVDNDLRLVGGVLDVSGSHFGVNLGGDFVNPAGESSFTSQNGTVILDGGNQSFTGSGATFYNLTKVDTDDGSDSILTFAAGSVYTITHWWTLTGNDSLDRINLVSSVPGQAWNVDPQTYRTLDFVDVTDSVNSAGTAVKVPTPDNVDGGGNTNWTFGGSTVSNVPSGMTVRLRDDSGVDPGSEGQGGNRYVRFYKSSGGDGVVDALVDFDSGNCDLDGVVVLQSGDKVVVDFSGASCVGMHDLLCPVGSTTSFRVCPDATTLAGVNSSCSNGVTFGVDETKTVGVDSVTVSQVSYNGKTHWKAAGLTSSGGQGEGGGGDVPEFHWFVLLVLIGGMMWYVYRGEMMQVAS